ERHDLPINTLRSYINAQVFEEARNDFIVYWSFFYHGGGAILRRAMARIYRVLKNNGTMLLTMLSKRNVGFGIGRRDSANFWVDPDAELDKAHSHCY
ncbi:MAG: class I SAM-dependent methyltransferase, partial [Pseudomonadota bacterium]|nr:class I SAM-dependent methyltransferase [Pseudomonadota bacterium]